MSPYSRYSLKSLSYLIIVRSDSYFKYLLTEASSSYNTFNHNDAFLQRLLSKKRRLDTEHDATVWNLELKT